MSMGKRWPVILIGTLLALCVIALILSILWSNFLVDYWWFGSLGYEYYFWQRNLYQYAVLISVSVVFFLIFFLNFWVASRFLGTTIQPAAKIRTPVAMRKLPQTVQDVPNGFDVDLYSPVRYSFHCGGPSPLQSMGSLPALYLRPQCGMADPVFQKSISYYLFSYPIYTMIQKHLLIAFSILLVSILILYLIERRVLSRQEKRLPRGARIHLSALVLLAFLIEIWDFVLQRYGLLYSRNHLPLFFGAGWVEMNIVIWLIWIALIFLAGAAFSFIYLVNTS